MARVTVEDCIDKVDSPYELVLVAKERATQLKSGIEPSVDRDKDKNTVIALREIAVENVKVNELTDGKGVPVVYDGVGRNTLEGSLECLKMRGMMVSFGNASGPLDTVNVPKDIQPKGLYLTRPSIGQ